MPKHASLHAPRNWPIWLGFGLLRLCILLPFPTLMALGRWFGRLGMHVIRRRTAIARFNLELCFPEMEAEKRHQLLMHHFESLGVGVMEAGLCWWRGDRWYLSRLSVTGEEHIAAALAKGKGAIIFTAHFTSMELAGRIIHHHIPVHPVYRPHENPVARHFIDQGRAGICESIPRDDVRAMVRTLRANQAIWLATDQNFSRKGSVFAPFFGIPAATHTSVSRLARMSGASVLPAILLRRPDYCGYELIFEPPLDAFPSGEDIQDAETLNRIIEGWVQRAPEQYYWVHRRFKSRPDGRKHFYPLT